MIFIGFGRGEAATDREVPSTRGANHVYICPRIDDRRPDQPTAPAHAARYDDAPHTQRDYIRHVRRLVAFLGRLPDTATEEDLRRFQIHQHEAGASVPTINGAVSALRFLYTVTLRRRDLARSLVATKRPYKVPEVLSVEEAARLLEAAPGIKYKAALGVAYGAGLRVSEVAHLKVDDIDSTRMLIRVEQGKGGRDRNAMLSPLLLELLRLWWREGKRRGMMFPHGWLFPGGSYTDPLSTRQLHGAVREAAEVAGICGRRLGCREFRPYAAWRHGLRAHPRKG